MSDSEKSFDRQDLYLLMDAHKENVKLNTTLVELQKQLLDKQDSILVKQTHLCEILNRICDRLDRTSENFSKLESNVKSQSESVKSMEEELECLPNTTSEKMEFICAQRGVTCGKEHGKIMDRVNTALIGMSTIIVSLLGIIYLVLGKG